MSPAERTAIDVEPSEALETISRLLGEEALVAWDRDGMTLPSRAAGGRGKLCVTRWNSPDWTSNVGTGLMHRRDDGIGAVADFSMLVNDSDWRRVLVRDPSDPLGMRWEDAP